MQKVVSYFKQKITLRITSLAILLAAVLLFSVTTIFAAPPGTQYNPAETLDPSCLPSDVNCSVDISSTGGDITIGDDVISGTADRILFLDDAGNLDDSADLLWDDANKIFEVGDVSGLANETYFSLDDASQNITLLNYPAADYLFSVSSDPLMGGLIPGGAMGWSKTSTGEGTSLVLGDLTATGGADVQGSFAYSNATQSNIAAVTVKSDRLNASYTTTTGGDGGTDSVDHGIRLIGDELIIDYRNDTQGISQNIQLTDTGINIRSLEEILIGDVGTDANGTMLTINDENEIFNVSATPNTGYTNIFETSNNIAGVALEGSALLHTKDATNEKAMIFAGDGTAIGRSDTTLYLGYFDDTLDNTSTAILEPDYISLILNSNTGDDVEGGFIAVPAQTSIGYVNATAEMTSGLSFQEDLAFLEHRNTTTLVASSIQVDESGILSTIYGGGTTSFTVNNTTAGQNLLNIADTGVVTFNSAYSFPSSDGSSDQVLQTNGTGTLSWVDMTASQGEPVTNYRLARELNVPYKEENTQVVQIPEFDDPVAPDVYDVGGSNDLIYIEEHDILFSPVRNDPPAFVRFNNPDDLTDYTYFELTGMGDYSHPDSVTYSEHTGKIYAPLSDYGYNENNLRIVEIDPVTLAYSLVIDYDIGEPIGGPKATIVDNHIFVTNSYYTPGVYKFNLDTFNFVDDAVFVSETDNGLSPIETDGTHIYVHTYFNSTTHTVGKINADTMIVEDTAVYNPGTYSGSSSGSYDDMVVWGNYIYVILGDLDVGFNNIVKINKDDLTDRTYLDLGGDSTALAGIFTDGRYIYYGGQGNTLGRFDPETNTGELYDASDFPGSSINELTTDGSRIFFTGYGALPVSGTGFVGRLSFFEGLIETYVLDANGNKLSTLDKVNSRMGINNGTPDYTLDVNYNGAGIVSRFTSTDGNCTINPAVVGGISCSSDETLKKDIEPIEESQLDKLSQISPVEYHWKNDENQDEKTFGFIAQDVQEILPELVSLDPTTQKLTMSYAGLAVPLVGSVRELGLRLASLEALNDLNINGNTNKITKLFNDFLLTTQRIVINGLVEIKQATIDRLFAKRVETETFCIDDLCITKDEFKTILDASDLIERAEDIFDGMERESLEENLEEGAEDTATEDDDEKELDDEQVDTETSEDGLSSVDGSSSESEIQEESDDATENQEVDVEEEGAELDETIEEDILETETEEEGVTKETEDNSEITEGAIETEEETQGVPVDTAEESNVVEEEVEEEIDPEPTKAIENTEESDTEPEPTPEPDLEPEDTTPKE